MSGDPELAAELRGARGILFVCSGNMLRSAFAELYARHLDIALPVRSIATTYRNDGIHPEAREALLRRGVDPASIAAFRPTHLDEIELEEGELSFGMTRAHQSALLARGDSHAHLLRALEGKVGEVDDPYFTGRFDEAFAVIARCVEALVHCVQRKAPGRD